MGELDDLVDSLMMVTINLQVRNMFRPTVKAPTPDHTLPSPPSPRPRHRTIIHHYKIIIFIFFKCQNSM